MHQIQEEKRGAEQTLHVIDRVGGYLRAGSIILAQDSDKIYGVGNLVYRVKEAKRARHQCRPGFLSAPLPKKYDATIAERGHHGECSRQIARGKADVTMRTQMESDPERRRGKRQGQPKPGPEYFLQRALRDAPTEPSERQEQRLQHPENKDRQQQTDFQ